MLWVPIRPARARLRPAANYAILQLCRVAANHVAQFSNGSCRFGPGPSAMKISAIISVITRLLSPGRNEAIMDAGEQAHDTTAAGLCCFQAVPGRAEHESCTMAAAEHRRAKSEPVDYWGRRGQSA